MAPQTILIRIPLLEDHISRLKALWPVIEQVKGRGEDLTDIGGQVTAVITNGTSGLSATEMARLPTLRVICAFGAGYENIDLAAASARGIQVYNTPGMNDATVADHAIGLALAVARGICRRDRAIRQGAWAGIRQPSATLNGSVVGIIGIGRIGEGIARRAAAFGATILYSARNAKPSLPWEFCADIRSLAERSDFLIVACPGGPATFHLIDAAVLHALGPEGILVNVARGSVVDTAALITTLHACGIAGAGLDVFEGEPSLPPELLGIDTVVLTPHIAGRSHAAMETQFTAVTTTLAAVFDRGSAPGNLA